MVAMNRTGVKRKEADAESTAALRQPGLPRVERFQRDVCPTVANTVNGFDRLADHCRVEMKRSTWWMRAVENLMERVRRWRERWYAFVSYWTTAKADGEVTPAEQRRAAELAAECR